jgi:hypothetical protein
MLLFVLADWLEQLTPELIRRVERQAEGRSARETPPAYHDAARLPVLLQALIQALREQHVDPTQCGSLSANVAFDVDAFLATLHILEQVVYDAIEE